MGLRRRQRGRDGREGHAHLRAAGFLRRDRHGGRRAGRQRDGHGGRDGHRARQPGADRLRRRRPALRQRAADGALHVRGPRRRRRRPAVGVVVRRRRPGRRPGRRRTPTRSRAPTTPRSRSPIRAAPRPPRRCRSSSPRWRRASRRSRPRPRPSSRRGSASAPSGAPRPRGFAARGCASRHLHGGDAGTATLKVSSKTARGLRLKSTTLARGTVRCAAPARGR